MSSAEQFAITFPGDGRSPGLDDALRNAGYRIIMLTMVASTSWYRFITTT